MNNNTNAIVAKLKELVQKGNVSRILIRRDSDVILNLPVTVGIAGAVVGLSAAKWLLIAGVVATLGFGCACTQGSAARRTLFFVDLYSKLWYSETNADTGGCFHVR